MTNHKIGTAAGQIYQYLSRDAGKPCSYSSAKKAVKMDGRTFDMAVGWLAREDKVALAEKGRAITISLK